MIRETWKFSREEAEAKKINQGDTALDAHLDSDPELERLLSNSYVEAMHAAVCANIGDRTPRPQFLAPFIRRNTVAHIGAHLAYDTALNLRTDLGENRSLIPHPTRQTLIAESKKALLDFVVPPILYEIVVMHDAMGLHELRQKLGNYAERPDIIEIQRFLAEALAGSDEERGGLIRELTKATTDRRMNISIDGEQHAVRRLAIMRADYLEKKSEYDSRLRVIFPTLAKPAPAKSKHTNSQ